jgi:hypothetical protein
LLNEKTLRNQILNGVEPNVYTLSLYTNYNPVHHGSKEFVRKALKEFDELRAKGIDPKSKYIYK